MPDGPEQASSRLIEVEQDRLVDFVNTATIGLHWVAGDGTILWANPADYEPLGYSAEEYIGRSIYDFHADESVIEDILARLKRGERLHEYPARLRCKDGSVRYVQITSSVRFDDEGNFVNSRCFTRDVTDEHEAQERLRLLAEASRVLASSLDFETTLASLVRLCVPRLADWCTVEMLEESGSSQQLAVAHVDPEKVELARQMRRRFPPDPEAPRGLARVMRTGEPEHVEDIPDELLSEVARSPEHERILRSLGLRSYLVVPIGVRGPVVGALALVSAESNRRYGPRDVEFATELATRAAQAIEHALLYRKANVLRQRAEDGARRIGMLVNLTETIAPALDPDVALEKLARFAVTDLADYCVAYALEDDGSIRRVALAHADPERQPLVEDLVRAGPPTLEDAHGAGAVLRTGEPMLATEIPTELLEAASQNLEHLEVLRELGPRSSMIVPLRARDRTLGAIAFATTDRSGRRYVEADVTLAQELASRAALLVDNARLYRQAREASGARDEILSIVSHDLRSPLNTVVTACELLELDPAPERQARARASIRRAARQMSRLLEDLLDVARIEEGRLSLERQPVDLIALLGEVAAMHGPVAEHRGVRLRRDAEREVIDADRQRLVQALSNLVDNALKFTPDGGEVRLDGTTRGDRVHITIEDTGPGIPDEQLPHLFDRFWRANNNEHDGVGLGLSIAKGIVEAHGGEIEASNAPGKGARFIVTLPKQGAGDPRRPR